MAKTTHAEIEATSFAFGGYWVYIYNDERIVAQQYVAADGWGKTAVDEAYAKAKRFAAQYGCE